MPRRAQIAVSPQLIDCKMACVCFEEGYIGTPSRAIEIKGRPNITRGNYDERLCLEVLNACSFKPGSSRKMYAHDDVSHTGNTSHAYNTS